MNRSSVYRSVRSAIASGELVRPKSCEICGESPPPAKDGRSQIHAHHEDYSRPLDVKWICAMCHRKETPFPDNPGGPALGETNGQAKLTASMILDAKRLWESGVSFNRLGPMFGVDRKTISRAIKGEQPGALYRRRVRRH